MFEADCKLSKHAKLTGESYFVAKKKMNALKSKVGKINAKSEFKCYIDYLVEAEILLPVIAESIIEKHRQEMNLEGNTTCHKR
ncbi:MAG: hypothetical protein LBT80_01800 [Lactobacillaceae bacterium]|jgi:hypothetical protein|nr:hypothetical protein [Lactobacillaceae bacterium]